MSEKGGAKEFGQVVVDQRDTIGESAVIADFGEERLSIESERGGTFDSREGQLVAFSGTQTQPSQLPRDEDCPQEATGGDDCQASDDDLLAHRRYQICKSSSREMPLLSRTLLRTRSMRRDTSRAVAPGEVTT